MTRVTQPLLPPLVGAALATLPLLGGCSVAPGRYPSLASRAIERTGGEPAAVPVPPAAPVDPALSARLSAIEASARDADTRFNEALPGVQRLAAASGPAGGEAWAVAEQALSALGKTRAEGTAGLQELDDTSHAIASSPAPSPAALAAIAAVQDEIARLDAAHAAALDAIAKQLPAD